MKIVCKLLLIGCLTLLKIFGGESDPTVEAYIVVNAESGKVLYEKRADQLMYPASTTKIATALFAMQTVGDQLDQMVTAPRVAIGSITPSKKRKAKYTFPSYWIEVGSSHLGIKTGERLSLRELLHGMLIASANKNSPFKVTPSSIWVSIARIR